MNNMKKPEIQKLRIDIVSGQTSALSLLLGRDGSISRQGNGRLPADAAHAAGHIDTEVFQQLLVLLDEAIFPHADVYDHPDKTGIPITYSVVFLGPEEVTAVFEFRLGSETPDVGELLPYFDSYIAQAVAFTDDWFAREKSGLAA